MAAMLNACEPKGAITSEPRPVTVTMGLALVLNPSFRSTSMPGMYCPVSVMRNKGSATLSAAFSVNSGMVKIGMATCNCRPDRSTRPCTSRNTSPMTRMPTTA